VVLTRDISVASVPSKPLTDARRVGKLHLPPGGRYFGSREAYDLTYRSSQDSGKFNALFAQVARNIGTDVATIRRTMRSAQR
jgi:hypothetical protein